MHLRQHEQREMNAIQQQQLEYESSRIKYWDLPEFSHHQTTMCKSGLYLFKIIEARLINFLVTLGAE